MYLVSAAQMRALDRRTIAGDGLPSVSGYALMTNAAAAVLRLLERRYPATLAAPLAILAGRGNNGGDGLVLARLLHARATPVRIALLARAEALRGEAARALADLRAQPGQQPLALECIDSPAAWERWRSGLADCGLLIDAIFGVGLIRAPEGLERQVIEDVNAHFRGPVIAIDLPSGLSADGSLPLACPTADVPVLRAACTVTFTAPKRGHFLDPRAAAVGALRVEAIGTAESAFDADPCGARVATPALCRRFLAPRDANAHKGSFGHVLVVGGSLGKSGAVALMGTAALRIGAGLVTAAVPRAVLPIVAGMRAELMTEPLDQNEDGALAPMPEARQAALLRPATAVAIGPGLGSSPTARALARDLMVRVEVPCVLDADGLNAYDGCRERLRVRSAGGVLTPHPGEMGRLFDVTSAAVLARPLYYAQRLAAESGAVVVLKLHRTLVVAPGGEFLVNSSGNPGMATAGAGDVLTGLLAGLIAQFPAIPLLETAAAAVYLHGRAGDAAAAARGQMPLLAGDLIDYLPAALAAVRREAAQPEMPGQFA